MNETKLLANYPDVLTAKQLEEILHISRAGAYNLMNRADFPTLHVGGRKLVAKDRLLDWMDQNTQGHTMN